MTTLRDQILASKGLGPVAVPCPEWGEGTLLYIHPLTGDQRDALEEESTELAAEADFAPGAGRKRLHARAVVRAARDAEGRPVCIIQLVAVNDRYVSVFVGHSFFTPGAAHANNNLACATYERATLRKVSVRDVVSGSHDPSSFVLDATDPTRIEVCAQAEFDSVVALRAVRLR